MYAIKEGKQAYKKCMQQTRQNTRRPSCVNFNVDIFTGNQHVTLGPYYCIITYVYIVIQQYGPSVTCCFYADICIRLVIWYPDCYLMGQLTGYQFIRLVDIKLLRHELQQSMLIFVSVAYQQNIVYLHCLVERHLSLSLLLCFHSHSTYNRTSQVADDLSEKSSAFFCFLNCNA